MEVRMATNPALPKTGKRLLGELTSKKLTMAQFELECAMWMLETLDDMRYRPIPTKPPEIQDYHRKKQEDSSYRASSEFWQQPVVRQYKAAESEIRALNRSNWHWLNEMKRLIPKEDAINQAKIKKAMQGYPGLDYVYKA